MMNARDVMKNALLSITAVLVLLSGLLIAGIVGREDAGAAGAEVTAVPPRPSFTLGAKPPRAPDDADDAVVILFDGSSWDRWTARDGAPSAWQVRQDGSVEV